MARQISLVWSFTRPFHRIGEKLPVEWLIDIDPSLDPEPRIMEAAEVIGGHFSTR
ncbi:hypothetical protein [Paenibacillus validus]|uniref:hypothetical protein n=1 Tax=Paenibacillus validus TaxID=44253 RepID=UPI003D2C95B9